MKKEDLKKLLEGLVSVAESFYQELDSVYTDVLEVLEHDSDEWVVNLESELAITGDRLGDIAGNLRNVLLEIEGEEKDELK